MMRYFSMERYFTRVKNISLLTVPLVMVLTGFAFASSSAQGVGGMISSVIIGCGLLLGLLVLFSTVLGISLPVDQAMKILALAAIPLVLKGIGLLLSARPALNSLRFIDPYQSPGVILWLRPLDVFEMLSALVIGFLLYRQPGSSVSKAVVVALTIASTWGFASHQYGAPSTVLARNPGMEVSAPGTPSSPQTVETVSPAASTASVMASTESANARLKKVDAAEEERTELRQEKQLQGFRLQNIPASRTKKKRLKSHSE